MSVKLIRLLFFLAEWFFFHNFGADNKNDQSDAMKL